MTRRTLWPTRPAAEPVAIEGEAGTFLSLLARFRRRLHWVTVSRDALVIGLAGVVAVEAMLIVRPDASTSPLAIGAVAMATLGLVLVSAYLRTPTLRGTVAALDLRTRRDEGLATALQFAETRDPVACLVHRAASARVAALAPRLVFPLEAPPHFRSMLAALAIVTVVCALNLTATSVRWPTVRGGVVISGGPAPMQTSARRQDPNAPERPSGSTASTGPLSASAAPPSQTAPSQRASTDPAISQSLAAAEPTGSARAAASTTGGAGPRPATAMLSDGASGAGATASPQRDVTTPRSEPGGTGGRGGIGGGAGGGASAAAEEPVNSAGGVSNGALIGLSARSRLTSRPASKEYAARYRAARARAEVAVQQERIPPRRRAHVREYFATIHPAGLP